MHCIFQPRSLREQPSCHRVIVILQPLSIPKESKERRHRPLLQQHACAARFWAVWSLPGSTSTELLCHCSCSHAKRRLPLTTSPNDRCFFAAAGHLSSLRWLIDHVLWSVSFHRNAFFVFVFFGLFRYEFFIFFAILFFQPHCVHQLLQRAHV